MFAIRIAFYCLDQKEHQELRSVKMSKILLNNIYTTLSVFYYLNAVYHITRELYYILHIRMQVLLFFFF